MDERYQANGGWRRWAFVSAALTLLQPAIAQAEPGKGTDGATLRVAPLGGWVQMRSRLRAEEQETNRATSIDVELDESVPVLGFAARGGVIWQLPGERNLMLGVNYVYARGNQDFHVTTPLDGYTLELQPRYDSLGLTVDALVSRYFGVDGTLGIGRVRGAVSSELDQSSGGDRNGYLMSVGARGRLPLSRWVALSLALNYEILGLFPAPFGQWYSGDLVSLRLGFEFDWFWSQEEQP